MHRTGLNLQASGVDAALDALKQGHAVLLYDADGREEETDVVFASQFVTPQAIQTLRTDAGGLICTTLDPAAHEALGLPYLVDVLERAHDEWPILKHLTNGDVPYESGASRPSFGLTINHRDTFTGVTDYDRSLTIQRLAALLSDVGKAPVQALRRRFTDQFKAPGHVILLNAKPGLLEARRGHTELSTALLHLAGLTPSATICEMMNGPSGRALPKADAIKYAAKNGRVFLEGREVLEAWKSAKTTDGNPPRIP